MPDTIALLSGGIESTTVLHRRTRSEAVAAVFVDYGQRGAAQEYAACEHQCRFLSLPLQRLDMAGVGEAFRGGRERRLHVPIPHRNLLVLSLGLSFAAERGARRLALAVNRDDVSAYPSASTPFLERFQAMADTLADIELVTPLLDLDKAQVVALGAELGVDFAHTYSCLLGYELHCGACPQCEKRRAAFRRAGIADPTVYRR